MAKSETHVIAIAILIVAAIVPATHAQETAQQRQLKTMDFYIRSAQPTGLLIPMYVYPSDVHTNEQYNRLIRTKREHPTVPMLVIVNPASGPGDRIDANYTKAIDRLQGAGCVTLGYVSTRYAQRTIQDVQSDISLWLKLYPRIQGVFFDEMIYDDNDKSSNHQVELNQFAKSKGLWPTVANPGTSAPERYFSNPAADIIVIHESDQWPQEKSLHGDYFGGYADYPSFGRGVLLYGVENVDSQKVQIVQKYARWIYVTHDKYKLNDPTVPNPWDELSNHLELLCTMIEKSESK
jgi:hypothetical protein